ncbi:MAG TPA: c-type cytochrome [Thermoleophilaceae bacterium]|nr:c-type cytochrome [Thermoleophilaceae bacterium]
MSLARNTLAALAAAAVALPLAACGRDEPDLTQGKAMFTQQCGSCHTLARAGTQGTTGPNLDAAFKAALQKGFSRKTVRGIVHRQILHPRRNSVMPAGLVEGESADDVAAYVAYAADRSGEDTGALAEAGLAGATTGEQIFTAAGCAGCHTFSKAGANGTIGPSLNDLANAPDAKGDPQAYVKQSIEDPNAVIVKGFNPNVMPVFKGKLTDKQIQALVQYLLGG